MPTHRKAVLELVAAGAIWGFGFIATKWALVVADPISISGWRFVIAASLGIPYLIRRKPKNFKLLFANSILPGFLIGLTLVLQTVGLLGTTATKSALITCLYVLLVPILESFFGRTRNIKRNLGFGLMAFFGTSLMAIDFSPAKHSLIEKIAWGDVLTFFCAIAAAAHIVAIDRLKENPKLGFDYDPYAFNFFQCFWAGVPIVIASLPILKLNSGSWFPLPAFTELKPALGMFSITIGSTLFAFALQAKSQKVLEPATAALLFLLESPFAMLFAFLFLDERLTKIQFLGGTIVMAAITASIFLNRRADPPF